MQQIRTIWIGLDTRKRIIVVLASLAMFIGVLAMSKLASQPTMKLLYAGLETNAAGEVVQSLEQRQVTYEVRGGSIYVPANERDELRMTLASEGLPTNGERGYELLDSLSGFGTTSQMFDAAYWRAKEGELARTIIASRHISQARVHIAHDGSNPFQRSVRPTASVSVVPSGGGVTAAQGTAIRYLVSSAVAGLAAEDVAVIDANGSLVAQAGATAGQGSADQKTQKLRERVRRLVEARVGPGNAVVEVAVDTVTETRSIRERRLDPASRVAISSDVEESADSSTNKSGSVTVASNLPQNNSTGANGSKAQTSSTRERVNYEVSQTELNIQRAPGAIKRLTVAVLVNGTFAKGPDGQPEFRPRSDEELSALRELVSSAVGFDADRGDVITLKSMELPAAQEVAVVGGPSLMQRLNIDVMSLIQIATLALVTLALGFFVVRPILSKPSAFPAISTAHSSTLTDVPALTGEIDDGAADQFDTAVEQVAAPVRGDRSTLPSLTGSSADPGDRLRAMIGERQEETVEILRSWLEEKEETA